MRSLLATLQVSPSTLQRELADLNRRGLLRRTRGGVTTVEPMIGQARRREAGFHDHASTMAPEKRRIAHAAAELIETGDTIAIGAGTTSMEIARAIDPLSQITVVTNTVNVAMELSRHERATVFVTGGELRREWFSLVGQTAIDSLRRMYFDKVFLSPSGIDLSGGLTDQHYEEARVRRVMIEQSRKRIVVADCTKFEKAAAYVICPVSEIDLIITDSGARRQVVKTFWEKGIDVRLV